MNQLTDKTNGFQKILAIVLLLALGYGAVLLLNEVIPPITELLKNIWLLLAWGVPLAILIMWVLTNPTFIWGFFKTLSYKLTAFLVKMDPLSVMDRYVEYLQKKLINLAETINVLSGKKTKLDRELATLKKSKEENLRLGKAAMKVGNTQQAGVYGIKVQTDEGTIKMLTPMQERAERSLTFLNALAENWKYGIEKLQYQIKGKRAEYEIIKETTKGLKSAEDFINSDNEAAKLYGMSVKALEESVTQQIGYIDEFEKKSKSIMDNISIEKQAMKDEGLAVLEQYMNDDNLKLDFSSTEIKFAEFEEVPRSQVTQPKFNFLTNKK